MKAVCSLCGYFMKLVFAVVVYANKKLGADANKSTFNKLVTKWENGNNMRFKEKHDCSIHIKQWLI